MGRRITTEISCVLGKSCYSMIEPSTIAAGTIPPRSNTNSARTSTPSHFSRNDSMAVARILSHSMRVSLLQARVKALEAQSNIRTTYSKR